MPSTAVFLDANIVIAAGISEPLFEHDYTLKHIFADDSVPLFELFDSFPDQTGYILPQVKDEALDNIEEAVRDVFEKSGLAQEVIDDYYESVLYFAQKKLEYLIEKFRLREALPEHDLEVNGKQVDTMCDDLKERFESQTGTRPNQLARFMRKFPNEGDKQVLTESITAKPILEKYRGKRAFLIASQDTGFFSPYIDGSGVLHDEVTREIKERFGILCGLAQATRERLLGHKA